jgi:hypothetical protein
MSRKVLCRKCIVMHYKCIEVYLEYMLCVSDTGNEYYRSDGLRVRDLAVESDWSPVYANYRSKFKNFPLYKLTEVFD